MSGVIRRWTLVSVLLVMFAGRGVLARAQGPLPTTTVQDTVYSASGAPASGNVLVSWGAFTTAAGASVPAGSTSATIGANGLLSIALAPNAQATPMGSYYTATFHLSDGTTSRQFWVVPETIAGGGPAKLAAIQNSVLPTSVAMQTVSKAYVDTAIAKAVTAAPAATSSLYVQKTGDTMSGPLLLPADPVSPLQAADKNYVDENVTAIASGVGGKVSLLPAGTQVVTQPSGTQLETNLLNGELYANEYLNGFGNNGIVNALAAPDCTSGCDLKVDPKYAGMDTANFATMPGQTAVIDQRGGADSRTTVDPLPKTSNSNVTESLQQEATLSAPQLQALRPGAVGVAQYTEALLMEAPTGGSNLYPQTIETPPYFKNTYGVLQLTGVYNTQGQHVQFGNDINCYGVGDCLAGSQFIQSSGGYRDNADEGAHPFDLQVREDSRVYAGTCTSGCTPGATSLFATATSFPGTQGDGRFLIDKNPAKTITTGQLIGGTAGLNGTYLPFGLANFAGTSFPVSVLLQTAQAATSQPTNMAAGTVTLSILTTGVGAGYSNSTSALPATTGIACLADGGGGASDTPNYEMASYTVVDASHLTLTLNKVHELGATISVGGLCGYGIEQTVDTRYGIRQVFPVVGSLSTTSLYYAESGMALIGNHSAGSTSGYLNQSFTIASIVRSNNVVTVTVAGSPVYDLNGLTVAVAGVADSSYNGSFQVSTTAANTFTYPSTGANSSSSGGTLTYMTGGYVLYPLAEVLSVFNAANKQVDGTFTLAPNTVAWAAGDALEEPHYYKQQTYADTELVTQYVPRPEQFVTAGKFYGGLMGVGARGWQVANTTPTSLYLGAGGSYNVPDDAYVASGPWGNDFEVDAGANAVTRVHCNLYTCGRWDSTYKLFDLDSISGEDYLIYSPSSYTATWQLGGTQYSFSPQAFTAPTINVGTLNATTINAASLHASLPATAITSGSFNAALLPLFGASGSAHAQGAVPDPGATAGSTRYLREDGSWMVPPVGGTLSAQNANAIAITGGTIDGTVIGATTPSTAKLSAGNAAALTVASNSSTPGFSYNAMQSYCNVTVAGSRCYGGAFTSSDNTASPASGNHLVGMQTQIAEPNAFPASGTDMYGHVSGFNLAAGLWPGAAFRVETQGSNLGQIATAYDMTPGITPNILWARPACTTGTCNSAVINFQGYSTGTTLSSTVQVYGGSDGNYHVLSPSGKLIADPLQAATSTANFSSATNCLNGSTWTGSAATNDAWCYGVTYSAGGANPHTQLTWSQTGSTGLRVWQFPSGTYLQDGGTTFKDNSNNLYAATYVNAPFHTQVEQAKITAASTITPTSGLFHLTGTTTVSIITPPSGFTAAVGAGNGGTLDFVADTAVPFAAGTAVGSLTVAFTATAGMAYHCLFTPSTGLWYCK